MVRLQAVRKRDRELLWDRVQEYLKEMTALYDDLTADENGDIRYEHFDDYFTDPKRHAYFILDGSEAAGFALLCPYSNIGQEPDQTMAEFTVFPPFRGKHVAREAVRAILAKHPGRWEIRYSENNPAAKKLWNSAAAPYEPEVYKLSEEETVLVFDTKE